MLFRLLLLLTVVPLVELMILLRIAKWINWEYTIALVIVTGIIGAWLARREGIKTFLKIQTDLQSGVAPASTMIDGVLILVAGAFLVTPGVLTDVCGFCLLIAPIRTRIRKKLAEAFQSRIVTLHPTHDHTGPDPFHTNSNSSDSVQPDPFIDIQATSVDAEEKQANHTQTP